MKRIEKFIVALGCIFVLTSCNAQNTIGPVEWEKSHPNQNLIMFEFCDVVDVHYTKDDNNFWLEYCDPDAFDLDNLAYTTGREKWYGDYIAVDIQDSLVSQFLEDWGNYASLRKDFKNNWEEMDKLSYSWGLLEIWLEGDVRFELIHLPSNFNWWE